MIQIIAFIVALTVIVWIVPALAITAMNVRFTRRQWAHNPRAMAIYVAEERANGREIIFLPITSLVKLIKR